MSSQKPVTIASLVTHPEPELVMGVVGPVGTDFDRFEAMFTALLKAYQYQVNPIRLSSLANVLQTNHLGVPATRARGEFDRINRAMDAGNALRAAARRGDILALHAIAKIHRDRPEQEKGGAAPLPRRIHLLRSLKHPDEVEALRRIYGPGFFLIGINSREEDRRTHLIRRKKMTADEANKLIERDQSEGEKLGQQTRDTFELSDVFIRAEDNKQLGRFLDLIFGHPFLTPTRIEDAMFLAYASSLRSAQLARQVGAVILSSHGDVIATGANEVPRFGGGHYWPDDEDDRRDHVNGYDSNDRAISEIIDDIVQRVSLAQPTIDKEAVRTAIHSSSVADLTEYGRVVHAEMQALSVAARVGVSVRGGTLVTTTFPCHNCAKHIVAAGLRRVVFVEPYPKSKAIQNHSDSISVEIDDSDDSDKVLFTPFEGVTARRFVDLFSMKLSSGLRVHRKQAGKIVEWYPHEVVPRVRMSPLSYMERELRAIRLMRGAMRAAEGRMDAAARAPKPPKG